MSKSILLIFWVFSSANVWGQIQTTTVRVAEKNTVSTEKAPYDSTVNLPPVSDLDTYVGQLVYIQGIRDHDKGYFGFVNRFGERYGSPSPNSSFFTRYEDLYGKYFIVSDVKDNTGTFKSVRPKTLTLRNRDDDSDVVYYSPHYEGENPWLTVSYYNYLRALIGQKFYLLEKGFDEEYNYGYCLSPNDLYSGEKLYFDELDLWELTEIAEKEDDQCLIAIFKNKAGNISYCDLFDFGKTKKDSYKLLPQKEFNRLSKKYGAYYTKMMIKHDYQVGMPKELFRLMRGAPTSINYSSYQEQWVYSTGYDADYYYFSNGKLTGWN